jgi:hypothetical protein
LIEKAAAQTGDKKAFEKKKELSSEKNKRPSSAD